jgi:Glyoxalase/Bleomycin resistance protein/Dioxygenase superfamily
MFSKSDHVRLVQIVKPQRTQRRAENNQGWSFSASLCVLCGLMSQSWLSRFRFRGLIPALPVADVDATLDYYRDALGFSVEGRHLDESGDVVFGSVLCGQAKLYFSKTREPIVAMRPITNAVRPSPTCTASSPGSGRATCGRTRRQRHSGNRSNTARKLPIVLHDERHNDDDRGIDMDDTKISKGV